MNPKANMDVLVTRLFNTWIGSTTIQGLKNAISLDEKGMACVEIDDGLFVNFQAQSSPPVLTMYVLAGALPLENRAFLMQDMLEANLLWASTAGATLSLHRPSFNDEPEVVTAQALPVHKGTAAREVNDVFENVCLVALDWRARLENRGRWTEQADMPSMALLVNEPLP